MYLEDAIKAGPALAPKDFQLGNWGDRRDFNKFAKTYGDPQSGCNLPEQFMTHYNPMVPGRSNTKGKRRSSATSPI